MLKQALTIFLFGAMAIAAAQAAETIGFKQIEIPDAVGDRPLHAGIWYPTDDDGPFETVGENRARVGMLAIRNALPVKSAHALVILSHGYGGSWRNLSWLAERLVHAGYVVAAPDHPGTTTFDRTPAKAAQLWERPHDLSRVIDALMQDSALAGTVAPGRIAAIGHSLGGWSVMPLGGARFSANQFTKDCKTKATSRVCALAVELGIVAGNEAKLGVDLSDKRIGAVVSLDLGLARGFTPESLAVTRVPVLIIGAGVDIGDLPARLESGYLAANLPPSTSHYIEIPDAMHFSFMQICKPGAIELIEKEEPGAGIVCKDGGTRGREAIHREVGDMIIAFLAEVIPQK